MPKNHLLEACEVICPGTGKIRRDSGYFVSFQRRTVEVRYYRITS